MGEKILESTYKQNAYQKFGEMSKSGKPIRKGKEQNFDKATN